MDTEQCMKQNLELSQELHFQEAENSIFCTYFEILCSLTNSVIAELQNPGRTECFGSSFMTSRCRI